MSALCNAAGLEFVVRVLNPEDVAGKNVIEIGAYNVNGSARTFVEAKGAATYLGVDIEPGPGVDVLCRAEALVENFGDCAFDLVLSTEMIEHVADWRAAVTAMKRITRPGGLILLTTRSAGFPLHGFPDDYWRFETSDMQVVFADCDLEVVESDPSEPGVFVAARRPSAWDFQPLDLTGYALRSISTGERVLEAPSALLPDSELALLRKELTALRSTKTFRYTARARSLYASARNWGRRSR